jgi:hypothetical protein
MTGPRGRAGARLVRLQELHRSAERLPGPRPGTEQVDRFRAMGDVHPSDLLGLAGDGVRAGGLDDEVRAGPDRLQQTLARVRAQSRHHRRRIGLGEIGHDEAGVEAAGARAQHVRLQDGDPDAGAGEVPSGGQPDEPRADDRHVDVEVVVEPEGRGTANGGPPPEGPFELAGHAGRRHLRSGNRLGIRRGQARSSAR